MPAATAKDPFQRAIDMHEAGDAAGAEKLCRSLLRKNPQDSRAMQLLGAILARRGDMDEAEKLLRRSIELHEDPAVIGNLALLLRRTAREAEAVPWLARWTQLAPGDAQAWLAFARTLKQLGRWDESAQAFHEALALRPDNAGAWNDLGAVHHQRALASFGSKADGHDLPAAAAQAIDAYTRAAQLAPDMPEPWCNAGAVQVQFGRFDEGRQSLERALRIDPNHWLTRMHMAQLRLLQGDFEAGWRYFQARHEVADRKGPPAPSLPRWQGDSLAGRSIVLWYEEGYGDCIQFVRYATLLKKLGATRVGIVCPKPLASLLATAAGLDEVTTNLAMLPAYDCWAYYLDLPMHCGTRLANIPASLPYLQAHANAVREWKRKLPKDGLRVGLNWKGSPRHPNDSRRSLAGVQQLAPLWKLAGVHFVSLHKGEEPLPHFPPGQLMTDAGSQVDDFAGMAAVIDNLDLVISVDSAVAHLAGAMGKPVWVVLPAPLPDWRWQLGRDDSPWYPGVMRLFRQRRDKEWSPVVAAVADALAALLRERETGGPLPPAQELQQAVDAYAAGDAARAQRLCRSILAANPSQGDALQLLGAIRAREGATEEAEVLLRHALKVQETPVVLRNLGLLLRRTGREAEALPLLERWTRAEPAAADAWASLAKALDKLGRLDEADAAYTRSLDLQPEQFTLMADLGELAHRKGELERAAQLLERANAARPGQVVFLDRLAQVYNMQALRDAADARDGEWPAAALQSLAAFKSACEAAPDNPDTWSNYGVALQQFGRFDEAWKAFAEGLRIAPDHTLTHVNLGHLELLKGQFDEGWAHYAARYRLPMPGQADPPDIPHWSGDAIAGRSVLLWHEQGFGDCVQFVRYAPLLKALGASRVGVTCPPALARLLASVPGVDEVRTQAEAKPDYDCWAYYLEVPRYLRTNLATIPAQVPYIFPDAQDVRRWSAELPAKGLRVGLVWKGSKLHGNDAQRSLPGLAALAPLWQVSGVRFFSLQKGQGIEEAARPPGGQALTDLGPRLEDFAETAAVIANLDLLICVDTAVAHVAGAMGRPAWVLVPSIQLDWRWMLDRDDSPWYPKGLRLFRQQRAGHWGPVVESVERELALLAATAKGRKVRR